MMRTNFEAGVTSAGQIWIRGFDHPFATEPDFSAERVLLRAKDMSESDKKLNVLDNKISEFVQNL